MQNPRVCIFCRQRDMQTKLKNQLRDGYVLFYAETIPSLHEVLKKNEIACIIAHPIQDGECRMWTFREVKEKFEIVPIIITCSCDHADFIAACAETIADECIDFEKIESLPERIQSAIDRFNFQSLLPSPSQSYPPRVRNALKLTHLGFSKIKFAEEVSLQLGVSVTTFRKEFKRSCGMPFTQYLIRTKLLYAAYLAENNGLKGKAIAYRCGFNDEHEFYRAFKRKIGMPFSAFRKKYSFCNFEQLYRQQNL
ncbi:MAG: helix-turn-helix domain-containing protein [bacterium]